MRRSLRQGSTSTLIQQNKLIKWLVKTFKVTVRELTAWTAIAAVMLEVTVFALLSHQQTTRNITRASDFNSLDFVALGVIEGNHLMNADPAKTFACQA